MRLRAFSVKGSEYVRIVFSQYFRKYWILYAMPLISLLVLCIVNINFLFVAFIYIYIIIPFIRMYLYYYYCLCKEIQLSILSKDLIVSDVGFNLEFEGINKRLEWKDLSGYTTNKNGLIIGLKVRKYTYFIVPFNAFSSTDTLKEFVKVLNENGVYYNKYV